MTPGARRRAGNARSARRPRTAGEPLADHVVAGAQDFTLGPRLPRQHRRHEVRPGITGLAQVNGRNSISWEEKFELDVRYVETHSFLMDMGILIKTLWTVLACRDINDGKTTMTVFKGSKMSDKDSMK